jgi:hypothetical protein
MYNYAFCGLLLLCSTLHVAAAEQKTRYILFCGGKTLNKERIEFQLWTDQSELSNMDKKVAPFVKYSWNEKSGRGRASACQIEFFGFDVELKAKLPLHMLCIKKLGTGTHLVKAKVRSVAGAEDSVLYLTTKTHD